MKLNNSQSMPQESQNNEFINLYNIKSIHKLYQVIKCTVRTTGNVSL